MHDFYARISKAGRIVCGRWLEDEERYTCDEPVAEYLMVQRSTGPPARYLLPLEGWRLDKKGVWQKTSSVEDRRAHGIAIRRKQALGYHDYPTLPALVRCPKCHAVQWLDPVRLRITPGPNC